ncbi:hypothetical protein [Geobacter sp.]|uniref:hypothetical protein n=1 Tax=Geobacter sp. TaxID=46610 RepID=UPI002607C223|nr:hypothetical protein [Geobacter sp.]
MKRALMLATLFTVSASPVFAADVGFDLNINVGNRPQVVVPAPPVAVVPPGVVFEEPPVFIAPPRLGFYVGVDIPYDIFFISGRYYLYQGNSWYVAPHYNGPWGVVRYRSLPPGLRRHRLERIHYYRDHEYRVYRGDHDHYRGRYFRPEKEWKERRKEEHERWKEERKWEKEERKHRGRGHWDD